MASSLDFVVYACEQMRGAGTITYRKMFGEYAFYCEGKVVGLICDNQVFVKHTADGEKLLANAQLAPPYEGAKPHILLEALDDQEFLAAFISATCAALPMPKPKKKNTVRG
ncbi:MAG: TfoX/Sxy family protein [Clostridia bacterium]